MRLKNVVTKIKSCFHFYMRFIVHDKIINCIASINDNIVCIAFL